MLGIKSSRPKVKTAALTWIGALYATSKVNCKKSFTCFGALIDSIACITDAPLLISVIN